MYENMDPAHMDNAINKKGRQIRIYFIGFCSMFMVAFLLSMQAHYFFSALIAFLFIGFLLVYYMQIYSFIRIMRIMQFDGNFINDALKGLNVGGVNLDNNCPEIDKNDKS